MGKKKGRKKPGKGTNTAAYKQAADRRSVAKMMACGYDASEIAKKLGLHYNTVLKYRSQLAAVFHEQGKWDYQTWLEQEIRNLETTRQEALRCFYEERNRHGEGFQSGYLTVYAKLTDALHEMMHLRDPQASHMVGGDDADAVVVEVMIETREQADAIMSGRVSFDQMVAMEGGQHARTDSADS